MAVMTLSTAFTKLFGVRHPIALAPMGGSAGGELTAAVSRGGGLGLLGSGNGDADWLARELPIMSQGTGPWGVGRLVDLGDRRRRGGAGAGARPAGRDVVFWGPGPVRRAHPPGGRGTDHSGHRSGGGAAGGGPGRRRHRRAGHRKRWTRRPARTVHLAVRAAGGGPGGTRAGTRGRRDRRRPRRGCGPGPGSRGGAHRHPLPGHGRSLVHPSIATAIVEGRGQDTERNRVLDIARGSQWPSRYTARALPHRYLDQWRGREAELAADPQAQRAYQEDVARGEVPPLPVWAGEAVDLITDLPPPPISSPPWPRRPRKP
jgi:nitronate monooxygenase